MDWPETADASSGNLVAIEEFLREQILDAHVTLLGEIDLSIATDYAGVDWSMAELANFGFSKFKNRANFSEHLSNLYPAIIAIWAVNRAQNLADGTELWANSGLSDGDLVKLASAFSASIEKLELENFKRELRFVPNQRHVNLARMHAILPTYALTKYAAYIRAGVYYHRQPARVMQSIVEATDIAKPIQRLFEFQPHLGIDLVDRCMKTMRLGNKFGLPPRIAKALLEDKSNSSGGDNKGLDLPTVKIDLATGELYVDGHEGWSITSSLWDAPNPDDLHFATIYASRDDEEETILDPRKGYLLFDQDRKLIEQRSIPASGAYIAWSNEVSFDTSALVLAEPQKMGKRWRDWRWGWCRIEDGIELQLADGKIVLLGTAPEINLKASPVPSVFLIQDNAKVYGEALYFEAGQHASLVNNRTNDLPRKLSFEGETLLTGVEQRFDLTVFAGLGRSKTEAGLFLPGFNLVGEHSSLLMNESRTFKVEVPEGWVPSGDLVISGREAFDPDLGLAVGKKFRIFKSSDFAVNLVFKPTVVNWTIEFDDQEIDKRHETIAYKYEMLQKIQKIVVHGCNAVEPTLFVLDGDAKAQAFKGSSRDQDAVFDLRPLRGANRKQKIDLNMTISGQRITLVSFYPKERPIRFSDLKDLRAAVDDKGWFSDAEWLELDLDRQRQNHLNRNINRYGSGR